MENVERAIEPVSLSGFELDNSILSKDIMRTNTRIIIGLVKCYFNTKWRRAQKVLLKVGIAKGIIVSTELEINKCFNSFLFDNSLVEVSFFIQVCADLCLTKLKEKLDRDKN